MVVTEVMVMVAEVKAQTGEYGGSGQGGSFSDGHGGGGGDDGVE